MSPEPTLTPTQDLVMEVLAARHRLGEPFWSIERRNLSAIRALAELGLVTWREHNASPAHVYVSLTGLGRDLYITDAIPRAFDETRIARAVGDPGSVVGRRDPGESVTRWSTRAVMHTLLGRA